LITVTREDLSAGYQTAQTAHALAEYAFKKPRTFKRWRRRSGYLICLAVKDRFDLVKLMIQLSENKVGFVPFYEPDVDQVTAITIDPCDLGDKLTAYLPLANKRSGTFNKNDKQD
jgi:hypothetical protein